MKKMYVFLLLSALLWTSCSRTEVVNPVDPDNQEIKLQTRVRDMLSSTRGAYEGTDLSANPLTAMVLASLTTKNYTTLHCNGTMTFNGTGAVSYNKPVTSGSYLFPGSTTRVYLTGLYPGTGWDVGTVPGTPSFTITGKDDVMLAAEQETMLAMVGSGTYATLPFTHQLTLLRLSFYGDAQALGKVKVTDALLLKVNGAAIPVTAQAGISSATQAITFTGSDPSLPCYLTGTDNAYAGQAYDVTDTPVEQAYVLAPPVSNAAAGNNEYTFRISYLDQNDATKVLDVNVDLKVTTGGASFTGSTVGTAFNITFKFVGGQIEAQATVTDWTIGGTFEEEV